MTYLDCDLLGINMSEIEVAAGRSYQKQVVVPTVTAHLFIVLFNLFFFRSLWSISKCWSV